MDPWERTAERASDGAMCDALNIDRRDLRALQKEREEEAAEE